MEARYRALPNALRAGFIEPLARNLRPRSKKKGVVNKAIRFVEGLDKPAAVGHARWRMYLSARDATELFTPDAIETMKRPVEWHMERLYSRLSARSMLDRALRADFESFLPDDILVKLDRTSMGVSLEARVPYLDKEVVELAFRMPEHLKLRGGQGKWVLKKVAERYLPHENVYRRKEGFSAPLKQWIVGPYRMLMEELLDEKEIAQQGLFRVERIRELKREHVASRRNHAHVLWSLMLFQGWQRRWLNIEPSARFAGNAARAHT
jgi:asparagine synthase (glutamine-hydrolysing)